MYFFIFRLMDALGKEGLLEMYSFLQLLDTEDHPKKEQIGRMIDVASNAGTPRSKTDFHIGLNVLCI